jgi:hypothetical protein
MNFLKARFSEPSTWAGVATILATGAQAWATKDPQAILATLAGVVAMFTPEQKPA